MMITLKHVRHGVKRRGCNSTLTKQDLCFLTTQARNARKRPRQINGRTLNWPAPFHILSMYPDHTNPTERPHHYPGYLSKLLQEVQQFDYLGLWLDSIWIWKLLCHPSKKWQTKFILLSSLSPVPSAMTSTTPTPPSAAHQLHCLTFRNLVSSHTSSSTSATY